jgi:hypothetical protein
MEPSLWKSAIWNSTDQQFKVKSKLQMHAQFSTAWVWTYFLTYNQDNYEVLFCKCVWYKVHNMMCSREQYESRELSELFSDDLLFLQII